MKPTILKIENGIVSCELEDGFRLDVAQRWFNPDIEENDVIDIDFLNRKE